MYLKRGRMIRPLFVLVGYYSSAALAIRIAMWKCVIISWSGGTSLIVKSTLLRRAFPPREQFITSSLDLQQRLGIVIHRKLLSVRTRELFAPGSRIAKFNTCCQ